MMRCWKRGFLALGMLLGASLAFAQSADRVPLAGHVLPALVRATDSTAPTVAGFASLDDRPMTLTIVLRRADPAGFQAYLADVYDSTSRQFRKFLSPAEVSARFGPPQADYDIVAAYFLQRGFVLGEGSANRMTLTVNGTRSRVEQALAVEIKDFAIGNRTFHANTGDPMLPADIAQRVEAIAGLNSLAAPQPTITAIVKFFCSIYAYALSFELVTNASGTGVYQFSQTLFDTALKNCMKDHGQGGSSRPASRSGISADPPMAADGTGQTVGIVAYDTFLQSDIVNYIAAIGLPAATINNVTQVHVNGGATAGANQSEVLLDIDTILSPPPAPKSSFTTHPSAPPASRRSSTP